MPITEKINLFKELKNDYQQSKTPVLLTASPGRYLTITGQGAPGGRAFQEAVGALYSMAFTIKMTRKAEGRGDYVVSKLEALWWEQEGAPSARLNPERWQWQLMIRTPDVVDHDDLGRGCRALESRGKSEAVARVTLEELDEGLSVQLLHLGPYENEEESLALIRKFILRQGLQARGPHHEIYLSDPRRVPPERLKTILRQPVAPL
ncbi:GyrI-like domain-containing protein [Desulfogranum mediterraneum]|uniref:GyrI-like domain-containing protein n=1 Tax=Desulfogranum mediterraneum TaxID=160661 RepID=UPI0004204C88|nr:GyrI-like domain-containing protein [Desulfogranum mediterraneum]